MQAADDTLNFAQKTCRAGITAHCHSASDLPSFEIQWKGRIVLHYGIHDDHFNKSPKAIRNQRSYCYGTVTIFPPFFGIWKTADQSWQPPGPPPPPIFVVVGGRERGPDRRLLGHGIGRGARHIFVRHFQKQRKKNLKSLWIVLGWTVMCGKRIWGWSVYPMLKINQRTGIKGENRRSSNWSRFSAAEIGTSADSNLFFYNMKPPNLVPRPPGALPA